MRLSSHGLRCQARHWGTTNDSGPLSKQVRVYEHNTWIIIDYAFNTSSTKPNHYQLTFTYCTHFIEMGFHWPYHYYLENWQLTITHSSIAVQTPHTYCTHWLTDFIKMGNHRPNHYQVLLRFSHFLNEGRGYWGFTINNNTPLNSEHKFATKKSSLITRTPH